MAGKQFVCSTTIPHAWPLKHRRIEKCGQNVAKSGGFKEKDLVGCFNISNLQGLLVPGAATDLSLITKGIRLVLFDNELVHCQTIDILVGVFNNKTRKR